MSTDSNPSKIVLFVFAGRRANMEIQMPYLLDILDRYPQAVLHLWDLTRDERDAKWLHKWDGHLGGQVSVIGHLHTGHPIRCTNPQGRIGRRFRCSCIKHTPPYERPYQWYASQPQVPNTVYVKIDDDVLFLETDKFDLLLDPLAEHPNRIVSANVVNNAVCAKYEPELARLFQTPGYRDALGDPANPAFDWDWWALHMDGDFCRLSHEWFLGDWAGQHSWGAGPLEPDNYVRTRPGEAVSINCIAFTHVTMKALAQAFTHNPRLGDEGVVDQRLPWIALDFHAGHLTFGPQDRHVGDAGLDKIREGYRNLREVYLHE